MAERETARSLKARLRLRELAKYYCATSSIVGFNLGSGHGSTQQCATGHDFTPLPARLSPDGNLTALAQLAALRLGCQRSLISIIDDKSQHIIAEATRSVSTSDETEHDPDDGLVFGAQSLPITYGICPATLDAFLGESQLLLDNPNNSADTDHLVITDLLAESRTRGVPALATFPPILRYYVEVPLRTDAGYLLGSICVIDPLVRQPGPSDVKKLQEIATLVCQHLEMVRMKEDHRRAERLLEGLSHFIQGKDSISDWSKATPGQPRVPNVHPQRTYLSLSAMSSVPGGESTAISSPSVAGTGSNSLRTFSDATLTPTGFGMSEGTVSDNTVTPATLGMSDLSPQTGRGHRPTDSDVEVGFDPLPRGYSDDSSTPTLASISVRQAFSRASNLIRESMDLDATCFLEVPQNERFKNRKERRSSVQRRANGNSPARSTSETDSLTDTSTDLTPKDQENPNSDETSTPTDVLCHRLGFATRTKSSLAGSTTIQPYLTISATLLNQLTAKYPGGHIFNFDVAGSVSSGDDSQSSQQRRTKKAKLSTRLCRLFPTARSLIFLPMYDNDKQQVFSGFLGWTMDPARALQKHEVVYVSGFANSIMCEVMRLEATATDKAKSDFISSISHELRSPLHGILAAAQLLSESQIYPKQAEFIQMVDTCARTLLDIMNHLLDHAKINHFTSQRKRKPGPKKGRGTPTADSAAYSLVTSMNLLSVVEETTASMAASINQMLRDGKRPETKTQGSALSAKQDTVAIPIMLNIAPYQHWTFRSEAGSWRRIIMNLIGNSLKYTQEGHINVSLMFREQRKTGRSVAELKVIDTGQGISEEYLKHRLYTPFAQENNLSVGAGLGLSLVQQIVSSLQGEIHVHSEVGTGTEIVVRIPLTESEASSDRSAAEEHQDLLPLTTNRSFTFAGFDARLSIHEQPTGIPHPRTRAMLAMKDSVSATMTDWYGMQSRSGNADICVIEESYLARNLETFDKRDRNLLVVGLDGRGSTTDRVQEANFVYLLPPVGPIRMAQALKALLEARKGTLPQHELAVRPASTEGDTKLSPEAHTPEDTVPSLPERDASSVPDKATPQTSFHDPFSKSSNTPDRESAPSPDESRDTILLVDDNEINLRILVACISRLKLDYLTARDGRDALQKYVSAREAGIKITVVFMDISMPVMDGFASTREIRAFEKKSGMKRRSRSIIVALTGLASAEAQHEIQNCGFDLYLRKPVNLKTVREVLAGEGVDHVRGP